VWKEANNKTGEVVALDGDPLYNAQDMDIRNFKIGKAVISGRSASVPVNFTNFDRKERLVFVLKRVATEWKIDDIKYSAKDSLYKWLRRLIPSRSAALVPRQWDSKDKFLNSGCEIPKNERQFDILSRSVIMSFA